MTTILPTDDNNNPIPALRLRPSGGAHAVSASAVSNRNTVPFGEGTQILSVFSTVPIFLRFGGESITASSNDHYFPAGVYYDMAIGGDGQAQTTYVAVLRAEASDGMVYISEKI